MFTEGEEMYLQGERTYLYWYLGMKTALLHFWLIFTPPSHPNPVIPSVEASALVFQLIYIGLA